MQFEGNRRGIQYTIDTAEKDVKNENRKKDNGLNGDGYFDKQSDRMRQF